MAGPTAAAQVGQGRRPAAKRPWPQLPRWFVVGVAGTAVATVAVLAYAIVLLGRAPQPLTARRTPSSAGLSHDVGRYEFRSAVTQPVACGAVNGLQVAGANQADADLLADVVGGVCKNIRQLSPPAEDRAVQAARRGAIIGFAQFERTGEDSTTIAGTPPRVAVNTRFSVRGKSFKGYLAAVVVHELVHAGAPPGPVTADEEFTARTAESQLCAIVLPNDQIGRSCADANAIVALGRAAAITKLRAAGYP
ncbi:MAG: hypothetical protein QOG49_980 [Frankiaceae bacterium]|nr:hypothetical protein [Frankiaceae bacterium]